MMNMDETEDEITLQEAIEEQELLESQSAAVLGASDPQNCSYEKGYMKRQAMYACLTCNPKGAPFSQSAGVCLACSYTCHEGHELVELFTKRNFRCDCGNKKFPDNPCLLQPQKEDVNVDNVYNQNFNGVYCSCHRPYPDPDHNSECADDSMIQCIICEDWFHFQHCLAYLNIEFESMEEDFELICGPCMSRLDFLGHYSHLAVKPAVITVDGDGCNAEKDGNNTNSSEKESNPTINTTESVGVGNITHIASENENSSEISPALPTCKNTLSEDSASHDSGIDSLSGTDNTTPRVVPCQILNAAKEKLLFSDTNAIAWKGTLRSALCRCSSCLTMLGELKIQYLIDTEDTIEHYEAIGKKFSEDAKRSAQASIDSKINDLGRVGQLELIHGINHFKEQLADFLQSHAASGKVVQKEDVQQFFAKVNEHAAKRRRLE